MNITAYYIDTESNTDLAAASTRFAATGSTSIAFGAIVNGVATNPTAKSIVLGCPAPLAGTRLSTRLVAVSMSTAAKVVLVPAAARLEGANFKIPAAFLVHSLSCLTLRMLFAGSDIIGVNVCREIGGIHDAEVATLSFGLSLGELCSGGETEKAEGSDEVDDGGGLHFDLS